jgi:hypothetical protein
MTRDSRSAECRGLLQQKITRSYSIDQAQMRPRTWRKPADAAGTGTTSPLLQFMSTIFTRLSSTSFFDRGRHRTTTRTVSDFLEDIVAPPSGTSVAACAPTPPTTSPLAFVQAGQVKYQLTGNFCSVSSIASTLFSQLKIRPN